VGWRRSNPIRQTIARPAAVLGVAVGAGITALQPGYPRHAGERPWGQWTAASAVKAGLRKPAPAAAPGPGNPASLRDGRRPTLADTRPARTAASCAVWRGPRLRWVEESDPRARRVYRRLGGGRRAVPDIFKAMSLRPDLMEKLLELSERGHFSEGYLDRRTKERIATYVSALNGSHYCVGSHAGGLRDLGARSAEVAALARGDLDGAPLSPHQRALFEFIRRLTLRPGEITDADVKRLKAAGWRDEQIFEAAFDASLFALFNRVAITYGLDYPPDGWLPPARSSHLAIGPQVSRVDRMPVAPGR
jgi:uncharacterized peroxidase-related enzyme